MTATLLYYLKVETIEKLKLKLFSMDQDVDTVLVGALKVSEKKLQFDLLDTLVKCKNGYKDCSLLIK